MAYLVLKFIHVSCVVTTISLFLTRWYWVRHDHPLRHSLWFRRVPHFVDTTLLASALGMAWLAGIDPLEQHWLAAKILALLAYIVLGSIALKRGRTPAIRRAAGWAAVATFAYIVSVALTKSPLPGF